MMTQYLVRRIATQVIEYAVKMDNTDPAAVGPFGPDNPAPTITPPCESGCELIEYAGSLAILNESPSETSVLEWLGGPDPVWIERADLDAQRARKVADMSQACANAILAGFVSSALGMAYTYPAKLTDQANLSASVLASILPSAGPDWSTPFWCADAAGAWEFRPHTAAQIQQVGVDAKAAILHCMNINQQLADRIVMATAEQLTTIEWPT